jgi:hypothetical protein
VNRRSLAIGAAIALPAGFAAFHAAAGAPPAPAPSRPRCGRRDPDKAIRDLHRAYFAAKDDEVRICAEPAFTACSAKDKDQDARLGEAMCRQDDAVEAVGKKPAATLVWLGLKAAVFNDAVKALLAGHFEIDQDDRALLLAASIGADITRLVASEGVQA